MCRAAKHASYGARHASHARHKVIIRTTEINNFNFRLGNLDLDFEIRISDFAMKQ